MKRLRCLLIGWWETLATGYTVAPHVWDYPPRYVGPRQSEHGPVELLILDCPRCGEYREGPEWRRFYGVMP